MAALHTMPMQLVIRAWGNFAVTLVIFCGAMWGMYRFWYKNLPADREGVASLEEIEAGQI